MKKLLIFALILFSSILLLIPNNNGRITGKVIDSSSKAPLAYATITILNTHYSAVTNANGEYSINNVVPGTYSIKATASNYSSAVKNSIIVKPNNITPVNFELTAVQIKTKDAIMNYKLMESNGYGYTSPSVAGDNYYQNFNTEEYSYINENDFREVTLSPLSTFAADVDASSYSNVRRFINQNSLPYIDAVRIEELINYFNYDYKAPQDDKPLRVNMEFSDCPWNTDHKLVLIGLQSKKLERSETKPSNLVFLIDVSGSMDEPNKLPLVKRSLKLLVEQLGDNDRVSMVVYAGSAGLVLPSTLGSEKEKIIQALERLQAGGSTAGGAGIQLAYKIASENFIKNGNNRVILATDGDFNVGISNTSELVRFIELKKDEGIFLTVLGFGMGNYKDNRLQELADKGNGNHAYIDNIMEAKKVLVNEIFATLYTVAKDVKIQVEFNPLKVKSYKLIGYENRLLNSEDFKNDKKDGGEIGAGHTVTALYEIILNDNPDQRVNNDLKYQNINPNSDTKISNEILTVKIRYKEPDGNASKEFAEVLKDNLQELKSTSNNFRFASAVAQFGLILRDSKNKGTSNCKSVLELGKSALGEDKYGYRSEFLSLVRKAEVLLQEKLSIKD